MPECLKQKRVKAWVKCNKHITQDGFEKVYGGEGEKINVKKDQAMQNRLVRISLATVLN